MTTLEVLEPEFHVIELNGFFNGLRCTVGHPSGRFGADFIMKDGREISVIVDDLTSRIAINGTSISHKVVDYKYVWRLFDAFIYKKIPHLDHEQLVNLDWNLIEYYGLVSTADNEDGPWNRLISQQHHIIDFIDENDKASVVFFVEFNDFVVTTWL